MRIYFFVRWSATVLAVILALILLNSAIFAAWQTAAPRGYQNPGAWTFAAYRAFGHSLALICCAVFTAINVRPAWPYIRSKWNIAILIVCLASIIWPRWWLFWRVDECLDAGGAWDFELQECTYSLTLNE